MIHWELCKKLEYDHTNKEYMHKPLYILENDTNKIIWDFEVETARSYLVLINMREKNWPSVLFCYFGGSQSEIFLKWKDWQILRSCQRAERAVEHKGDGDLVKRLR